MVAALALAALVAAPGGAEPRRPMRTGPGSANPSALVAAEIAFARAAREKGQWTAFRQYADAEAVMFAPQPVLAREWLKGRQDPPAPVQWQAQQVWMSCDGSLGVTKGAWQRPDGSTGYFTTVWKRQQKGDYRWVLDHADVLAAPLPVPEMLSAAVADCPAGRAGPPPGKPAAEEQRLRAAPMEGGGRSDDGTLAWSYQVAADHSRRLAVSLRRGEVMAPVLSMAVAAPVK